MSATNVSPTQPRRSDTGGYGMNTPTSSAWRADRNEKFVMPSSHGLLGRMYPNLSREQAAALVQQKIMLEQLRKAATSGRRHR